MLRVIIFGLLASLLPLQVSAQTFKIATILPDGSAWMNAMREGADEVTRRTEGRVKFRFFPGGVMGNDKSVLRKIRIGQLQGGAVTAGGLSDIYPDTQVYGLPFVFRSYGEVDYVRKRLDPVILKGLEEHGFVSFGFGEGGFAYLMSDDPIPGVEELRQQKVWIPEGDNISRAAFEAVGVSPISLPLTDVLTGLQTGLIDTVATSPVGAIALQWHTRVKYLTDTPLLYLYGTMVVDKRAFKRLSAKDQAVVREVMGQVFAKIGRGNRKDNEEARRVLREQGVTFVEPPADKLQQWREQVAVSMKRLEKQGDAYSPETYEQVRRYLEEYRNAAAR